MMARFSQWVLALAFLCGPMLYAQIQFAPYQAFTTGSSADMVATGDLNNDGRIDIALATGYYFDDANDFKIFVYLQNTDGTLEIPVKYSYTPQFAYVTSLKIADLNDDSRNDIVVGFGSAIGVLYQNASGSFDPIVSIDTNYHVYCLNVGDFNNDGLQDVVVSTEYANKFLVYYQDTAGTLTSVSYDKPTSARYREVEVADMNLDGRDDLIFQFNEIQNSSCRIYNQNSSGTGFLPYTDCNTATLNGNTLGLWGIAVGDLNHDGYPDLAGTYAANSPGAKVIVWYQNAVSQQFGSATLWNAYDVPEPIEIADLNNDSKNEIVALHGGWLRASTYEQNANNQLSSYLLHEIPYASHYDLQGVSLGDVNGDGKRDIVIADYGAGLVILYNSSESLATDDFAQQPMQVYPNPAKDLLHIDLATASAGNWNMVLCDATGKTLLSQQAAFYHNSTELNVSQLQSGIYYLKLQSGNQQLTRKIIKK